MNKNFVLEHFHAIAGIWISFLGSGLMVYVVWNGFKENVVWSALVFLFGFFFVVAGYELFNRSKYYKVL